MDKTVKALHLAAAHLGSRAKLAAAIKKPPTTVNYWFGGANRVPAEVCPLIERATGGEVTRKHLRTDISWGG